MKTDSQRFSRFSCESVQCRGGRVTAMSENVYGGSPAAPEAAGAVSACERAALLREAAISCLALRLGQEKVAVKTFYFQMDIDSLQRGKDIN